jgi:hypothetical protein
VVDLDTMRGKKKGLIITGLAVFLAALVLLFLKWRSNQVNSLSLAGAPDGSFVMQVEKPLLSLRAPWEVPRAAFGDRDPDLRIRQTSPGAQVRSVTAERFELTADGGWDLIIESDGKGRVLDGTRLIFPISYGGGHHTFSCRHADTSVGYFNTTTRGDKIDGNFLLRLTQCKNVVSGKNTSGLPPFPVRGNFKGLPRSSTITGEGKETK